MCFNNKNRLGRRLKTQRRRQETLCKSSRETRSLKRWRRWGKGKRSFRRDSLLRGTWTCVNRSRSNNKARWMRCSRRSLTLQIRLRTRSKKWVSTSFRWDNRNKWRTFKSSKSSRLRSRSFRIESSEKMLKGKLGTDRNSWGKSWKRTKEELTLKLTYKEWNKRN
jgi:hypothetical protein